MEQQWWVQREAMKLGPYGVEEMRRHVTRGKVRPEDPVCVVGTEAWVAASEAPGIRESFPVVRVVPPSAPPPLPRPSAITSAMAPQTTIVKPVATNTTESDRWLVRRNGNVSGPFSAADLRARYGLGGLRDTDMVTLEGSDGWRPITVLVGPPVTPPSRPLTALPPSGSDRSWYVMKGGRAVGPWSLIALRTALTRGDFQLDEQVCEVGRKTWDVARLLPELGDLLPPVPDPFGEVPAREAPTSSRFDQRDSASDAQAAIADVTPSTPDGQPVWKPIDALAFGWERIKSDPGSILGIYFAAWACVIIVNGITNVLASAYLEANGVDAGYFLLALWLSVFACIFQGYMIGGMTLFGLKVARGQPYKISDVLGGGRFALAMLYASLLPIAVAGGLFLLIVPGVLLAIALSLTVPFIVDRNMGGRAAVKASWEATADHRINILIFGLLTSAVLALGACTFGFGLIVILPLVQIGHLYMYLRITDQPVAMSHGSFSLRSGPLPSPVQAEVRGVPELVAHLPPALPTVRVTAGSAQEPPQFGALELLRALGTVFSMYLSRATVAEHHAFEQRLGLTGKQRILFYASGVCASVAMFASGVAAIALVDGVRRSASNSNSNESSPAQVYPRPSPPGETQPDRPFRAASVGGTYATTRAVANGQSENIELTIEPPDDIGIRYGYGRDYLLHGYYDVVIFGHREEALLSGTLSSNEWSGNFRAGRYGSPFPFRLTFSTDGSRFDGSLGSNVTWQGVRIRPWQDSTGDGGPPQATTVSHSIPAQPIDPVPSVEPPRPALPAPVLPLPSPGEAAVPRAPDASSASPTRRTGPRPTRSSNGTLLLTPY